MCSTSIADQIIDATHLARTFSDHNPLEAVFSWGRVPSPVLTWRLWPQTLEDSVFCNTLAITLQNYFTEKHNTASTVMVEWDAVKAVIRGAAISVTVEARQEIHRKLQETEANMSRLEQEAVHDPTKQTTAEDPYSTRIIT